jgi:aminoglycoside phosphotransferase (APT) family kinase protein
VKRAAWTADGAARAKGIRDDESRRAPSAAAGTVSGGAADGAPWEDLYRQARGTVGPEAGLYHDNYVVRRDGTAYVIRAQRPLAEPDVEPRMYPEAAVLAALEPAGLAAPRLIHDSGARGYLVISHQPGRPVADLYPPGTPLPDSAIEFVGAAMSALYRVDREALGAVRPQSPWRRAGDPEEFRPGLLRWLARVWASARPAEQECVRAMGLPAEPFAPSGFPPGGAERAFRLCHGDLQRQNLLVARGDRYAVLDWELAVWGDPVWDVACHLHRAAYPPAQAESVRQRLLATCPDWTGSAREDRAYDAYLRIEQYRSLVLDCVRALRRGAGWDAATREREAAVYQRKLAAAGLGALSPADVLGRLERYWADPGRAGGPAG